MSSPYRSLHRADLRAALEQGPFARNAQGYELGSGALVCSESDGRATLGWGADEPQLEQVRGALAALDGVTVEAGGRVRVGSELHETPLLAYEAYSRRFDALVERLAPWGLRAVSLGVDPWTSGARALDAWVRVPLGSPATTPQRWASAEALAPLSEALFAASPLLEGVGRGLRSHGAAQRRAERTPGYVNAAAPTLVEGYIDWALAAPRPGGRAFREWLDGAQAGQHPDRADFCAHVAGLRAHVLVERGLLVRAFDAPPRAFACVPLVWWSVLLDDAQCLAELASWEAPSGSRLDRAASAGLSEPSFAAQARRSFALVAERLLARPGRYASPAMVAALIAFAERFSLRGRTIADEWLAHFARRRDFSLADLEQLQERWSELAGARRAA